MPRLGLLFVVFSCLVLSALAPAWAEDDPAKELVGASLMSEHDALVQGTATTLVVRLRIKPEWHVYWLNPGDAGVPTALELTLPKGLKSAGPSWPAPKRLEHEDGFVDFAYEGDLILLVPIEVEASAAGLALVGKSVSVGVKLTWLVCKDSCIPGEASLALSLPVRAKGKTCAPIQAAIALAKQARPRLASPLPKGVSASFQGLNLELKAPGAKRLTWFPLAPAAAGPADLKLLVAKGPKLRVEYPAEVRAAKRVRGLLAIQGKKHTTYHWVELPSPTP